MAPKRKSTSLAGNPVKKARKALTLETKMKVIKEYEEGKKVNSIARDNQLSHSTVSTILKDKNRIKEAVKAAAPINSTILTKRREGPISEMEKLLYTWLEDNRQRNVKVGFGGVKSKAASLFKMLKKRGGEQYASLEFVASDGWFRRFRERYQIHSVISKGEAASSDEPAAKPFMEGFDNLIKVEEDCLPEQICNVDETALFWKEMNGIRLASNLTYDQLVGTDHDHKSDVTLSLITQQQHFAGTQESNENTIKAGYEVAALIAKHCKPFTEGEFIKDCVMTMVKKICPEKQHEFAQVCLAGDTVAHRIEEVSSDIKRQLGARGKEFECFSLACEESTDASDSAQLLIFLRGVDNEMNVTEELLDLLSLKNQMKGTDLFSSVCAAMDDMKLPWNKISAIITDGAPSMTGEGSGLATLISNKVSEEGGKAVKLHCIIHQQVLCAKHLQYEHVMKPVINAINYIRSKALCHSQFQQFLSEIHLEYGDVDYTDVRWLSRGSALSRFYSLGQQIGEFLAEKGQPMLELSDPMWLADLGFLVDITKHLNVLNASLQEPDAVISQLYSHIKAFGIKLQLFERHLSQTQPNTAHFAALQEIMTRFPQSDVRAQTQRYASDISSLAEEFRQRFQDFAAIEKELAVFSSPFSLDTDDVPDHLQLELIELQCDTESRSRHQLLPLANFYRRLDKGRFPEIRALAKKMLSLFGSTHLCERILSVMNLNKSHVRTWLTDSHLRDILRINTTAFEPDLAFVLQSRSQYHPSH